MKFAPIVTKIRMTFVCILLLNATLSFADTKGEMITNAHDLINRVLPHNQNSFILEIISSEHGRDVAEVDKTNYSVVLRGNNTNSLAFAFNIYLSEVALIDYSWESQSPLKADFPLPLPKAKIRKVSTAGERFFNNTCTFGYTFPYWDWNHWQRFIDWMAMNGINRPLMQAGQEAVWLRVWKSFGMTEDQICRYFSSPAHLPWHRMGNMDHWGGPLPISYIRDQEKLQKQILDRCHLLGMKPILSAFAGHVPAEIETLYPQTKIETIKPGWGDMDSVYTTHFLDPHEVLFAEIQKRFLACQQEMYGSDHLYSADPFNEINPPSWEPDFLASVSKTIYQSMVCADPDAVWYQMSWTFYFDSAHWTQPRLAAMVHEVPKGKLVFLDYVCEEQEYFRKSDSFHEAPFIWCYLGNFGGNTHLVAPLHKVMSRLQNVRQSTGCIGVGSTLEGINANPVIYMMVLQAPWLATDEMSVSSFIRKYADSRSGRVDPAVRAAWKILADKVLLDTAVGIWNHCCIYQVSPVLDLKKRFWSTDPDIPYNNIDLLKAVGHLLQAQPASAKTDAYQFDLVNLTRQLLGNYGMVIYGRMIEAYTKKESDVFHAESQRFLRLGLEIDSLLGSRHEFLLGNWLDNASKVGHTPQEQAYYIRDAREIITSWHKGGGGLTDYSNRQWNGLMRSYYLLRWKEFISRLEKCLQTHTPFDEKKFAQWCADFEQNWVDNNQETFPTDIQANPNLMAAKLFHRYRNDILFSL